jgi:hypothetical protein
VERVGDIFLLLVGLVVAADGLFAYQLNNVCSPGDYVIQSEGEAIKQGANSNHPGSLRQPRHTGICRRETRLCRFW